MRIDGLARSALVMALAASLACARNTDSESGATGSVTTTADTGATIEVSPDTGRADTAGTENPARPGTTDSARMTIDSTGAADPDAGWPSDSGWGADSLL